VLSDLECGQIHAERPIHIHRLDDKLRKFTHGAEVDLEFLVKKHKEDITKGGAFVRGQPLRRGPWLRIPQPTACRPKGYQQALLKAEGCMMYERGLILWIREQSCKDLNRNKGGGGATPYAVRNCGARGAVGPWAFTGGGPMEEVV
jgi:hypothetical protein